jgi:hypothetical protein
MTGQPGEALSRLAALLRLAAGHEWIDVLILRPIEARRMKVSLRNS